MKHVRDGAEIVVPIKVVLPRHVVLPLARAQAGEPRLLFLDVAAHVCSPRVGIVFHVKVEYNAGEDNRGEEQLAGVLAIDAPILVRVFPVPRKLLKAPAAQLTEPLVEPLRVTLTCLSPAA